MNTVVNRIVIVGVSAGGLATAEALRRQGYGSTITLVGVLAAGKSPKLLRAPIAAATPWTAALTTAA